MSTLQNPSIFTVETRPVIGTHYVMPSYQDSHQFSALASKRTSASILKRLKQTGLVSLLIEYSGCGDSGQIDNYQFNFKNKPVNIESLKDKKYDFTRTTVNRENVDIREITLDGSQLNSHTVNIRAIIPIPRPSDWTYPSFDTEEMIKLIKENAEDFDYGTYSATITVTKLVETHYSQPLESLVEEFAYALIEAQHAGFEINDGGGGEVTIDIATGKVDYKKWDYFTERTDEEFSLDLMEA